MGRCTNLSPFVPLSVPISKHKVENEKFTNSTRIWPSLHILCGIPDSAQNSACAESQNSVGPTLIIQIEITLTIIIKIHANVRNDGSYRLIVWKS